MPSLTLKFKENVIGRFAITKGKSLTIGRRKDNDIVIDNLAVSGHHAKVDAVGDAFVLVDLQSKNGSFVNEQMVTSHWLKDGDVISIGKHLLVFSTGDAARSGRGADTRDRQDHDHGHEQLPLDGPEKRAAGAEAVDAPGGNVRLPDLPVRREREGGPQRHPDQDRQGPRGGHRA